MELPRLRQPKGMAQADEKSNETDPTSTKGCKRKISTDICQVIVSLKDNRKLVVSSDSYNGILTAGESYKCLLCEVEINVYNVKGKDQHKLSKKHASAIQKYPHLDEYAENLIRKIKDCYYCTICNVSVSKMFINRHLISEAHKDELTKAMNKAVFYAPNT